MSSFLLSLPELYASYKQWVGKNPQLTGDYETTIKWISYLLAGKINNSHVLSEFVYCLSNLLVLFNDRIISTARQLELPSSGDTLKLWLTVIEYCEVLFELSAQRLWGVTGKWLLIVGIQVFKCISRLVLVFKHKESIIQNPPIPAVDRVNIARRDLSNCNSLVDVAQEQLDLMSFTLKSSGKVVRRADVSPPIHLRNWASLPRHRPYDNDQTIEQALAGRQLIAETIYIMKPIAHLTAAACFGNKSWKPWIVALFMDLISLQLYSSIKSAKLNALTPKQRLQLSKRTVILIMYLLRSPFYEKHSKDRIQALLTSLSNNVPLAKLLCGPLSEYLPFWQSNYFYTWSS